MRYFTNNSIALTIGWSQSITQTISTNFFLLCPSHKFATQHNQKKRLVVRFPTMKSRLYLTTYLQGGQLHYVLWRWLVGLLTQNEWKKESCNTKHPLNHLIWWFENFKTCSGCIYIYIHTHMESPLTSTYESNFVRKLEPCELMLRIVQERWPKQLFLTKLRRLLSGFECYESYPQSPSKISIKPWVSCFCEKTLQIKNWHQRLVLKYGKKQKKGSWWPFWLSVSKRKKEKKERVLYEYQKRAS